jgi:hypothetical protein
MRAFLFDLWSHRGFRYTFLTVAGIGSFWFILHLALNWSGEKRWQRIKTQLEAEGETFDFYALYPPPIPDDQNFCAIEPLNGIRTPEGTSPEAVAAQAKRDEIRNQLSYLMVPNSVGLGGQSTKLADWALPPNMFSGESFDSNMRLKEIIDAGALPIEAKNWASVKTAAEKQARILGTLAAAVEERRHADFLPRQTREGLPDILVKLSVPHLNLAQDIVKLLRFHGFACIQAREGRPALSDTQSMLRLAQGADATLLLIGHLVGTNIRTQALQMTWGLIEARVLLESDLSKLQNEWIRCDIMASNLRAIRSEIVIGVDSLSAIEDSPNERWFVFTPTSGPPISSPRFASLNRMVPRGFVTHSKAATLEFQSRHLLHPLKMNGLRNRYKAMKIMEADLDSQIGWQHFDMIAARTLTESYGTISRMVTYSENQRLQAILACALERHFLRHGSYPATLEGLDPEFRGKNDLLDVNGEKMHYALVPGGRFRLWSPGPDGRDDGGKFGVELSSARQRSLHHESYLGDWVWRYDPAVKAP